MPKYSLYTSTKALLHRLSTLIGLLEVSPVENRRYQFRTSWKKIPEGTNAIPHVESEDVLGNALFKWFCNWRIKRKYHPTINIAISAVSKMRRTAKIGRKGQEGFEARRNPRYVSRNCVWDAHKSVSECSHMASEQSCIVGHEMHIINGSWSQSFEAPV